MAKDYGIAKYLNYGEDEDFLREEEIIDLVDAALADEQGVENKPEVASEEERKVQEEAGEETVFGKEMEEALGEESESSIDFQVQIGLDEGLKEILSEDDTSKLKELLLEEPVEKQTPR